MPDTGNGSKPNGTGRHSVVAPPPTLAQRASRTAKKHWAAIVIVVSIGAAVVRPELVDFLMAIVKMVNR